MVHFLEVVDRALTGKICSERDFDLKILVPKLREVVKEYDIKYDADIIIPSDDSLADAVFDAAIDLYSDVGTYCLSSERIIKFDENEIKAAIRNAPSAPVFGEGNDRKKLVSRTQEDNNPTWCLILYGGAPVSDETVFMTLVEAYGAIPGVDSITTPSLTTVNGANIRAGTPLEIYGAIRTVSLAREALRRAGRPGLPIMNCIATAESGSGTMAASNSQFGLRPSDGWLVAAMPELKLEFERLNKVAYLLNWGANIGAETSPLLGGYSGGPAGTAVINAASHIQGIIAQKATYQLTFPIHLKYACSTTPEVLWTISLSGQAISRNSHLPTLNMGLVSGGPMTEMCYYEIAAYIMAAVVSGLSIEALGVAKAVNIDHLTPFEPKFAVEVAYAATGMKRTAANEILIDLVAKYKNQLDNPPVGKRIHDCFDLRTGKPNDEFKHFFVKIKNEIREMGLEL